MEPNLIRDVDEAIFFYHQFTLFCRNISTLSLRVYMESTQVVIVSAAGRKLDNLQTMLESVDLPLTVLAVENCQAAINFLNRLQTAIVLIDYRNPKKKMEEEIRELIMRFANIHVVLLQNQNTPDSHFTQFSTSEVVYDDLSVGVLKNLINNIRSH
jgi:DNA-binding NtrC family response regulator